MAQAPSSHEGSQLVLLDSGYGWDVVVPGNDFSKSRNAMRSFLGIFRIVSCPISNGHISDPVFFAEKSLAKPGIEEECRLPGWDVTDNTTRRHQNYQDPTSSGQNAKRNIKPTPWHDVKLLAQAKLMRQRVKQFSTLVNQLVSKPHPTS